MPCGRFRKRVGDGGGFGPDMANDEALQQCEIISLVCKVVKSNILNMGN